VDRDQKARLDAIAAPADLGTFAILQQLGVGFGWSCAEVGAGSGTSRPDCASALHRPDLLLGRT